ncbi:hypothetical protein KY334_02295 [Candidatus Woesearchaeota archaeon]|nr:hypothetical protein [Candidatus Woesearchaeota archaeon]
MNLRKINRGLITFGLAAYLALGTGCDKSIRKWWNDEPYFKHVMLEGVTKENFNGYVIYSDPDRDDVKCTVYGLPAGFKFQKVAEYTTTITSDDIVHEPLEEIIQIELNDDIATVRQSYTMKVTPNTALSPAKIELTPIPETYTVSDSQTETYIYEGSGLRDVNSAEDPCPQKDYHPLDDIIDLLSK